MGRIPEEVISQVLDRCDIAEIISGYIPLKRAGRNFKALCPFHHEKTPSFVVNPDKQIFHCFGCGVGGNAVSFVMRQESMEFPEALKMVAQKYGISVPEEGIDSKALSLKEHLYNINGLAAEFYHQILVSPSSEVSGVVKYLKDRGVNLEIVKKFKLGFAADKWDSLLHFLKDKNISLETIEKAGLIVSKDNREGYYDRFHERIIFPIFDVRSRCIGFGARAIKEAAAKYVNSPETAVYTKGNHLYGFHWTREAVRQKDFVIIVEGYMDFIIPFQAGVDNIVASLGTALTVEQIRLLRRYTQNVVMLFDADPAGESAMVRSLDLLIEEGMNVKVAALADGEDPDSFIRKFGVESFQQRVSQAFSVFDFKMKTLLERFDAKTPEGKARICAQMFPMIQRFENVIIRTEYLKKLASVLTISEDALTTEIRKIKNPPLASSQPAAVKTEELETHSAEQNLLRLMLEDESFIPYVKGEIAASDFRDVRVRAVIDQMFHMVEGGRDIKAANVLQNLTDEKILKFVSQIMTSERAFVENKEKMRHDCVNKIKSCRLKLKRQELLKEIQLAEHSRDENRLNELKEEFNQIVKR